MGSGLSLSSEDDDWGGPNHLQQNATYFGAITISQFRWLNPEGMDAKL